MVDENFEYLSEFYLSFSFQRQFSTNTFKVASRNGASSGYGSGTFQKPMAAVPGKPSFGGVNMRQTKSIGGVQRPVSAVLPQSTNLNRRQEQDQYGGGNGRYSPVVSGNWERQREELNLD